VIDRDHVSDTQLHQIINHTECCKSITPANDDWGWCNHWEDAWDIDHTHEQVSGSTNMDNFDMRHFLKAIGVADDNIAWID